MTVGKIVRVGFIAAAVGVGASACQMGETLNHGYQLNEETLALVPVGSSRDQALLSLGTPSTTLRQDDGTETLYYISQQKRRSTRFTQARVVEQRVLAIYLGPDDTVQRIANYGLEEGRVFDYVRRITPTGGQDISFIGQLLGAAGNVNPFGTGG